MFELLAALCEEFHESDKLVIPEWTEDHFSQNLFLDVGIAHVRTVFDVVGCLFNK
jgi:hypothetical protein